MDFKYLSDEFYNKYDHVTYPEILEKDKRPYVQTITNINGVVFAIPLRSHISHDNVLWSDKKNRCGLDFSKAVVIDDKKYIDEKTKPHIRDNEYKKLLNKDYVVKNKMEKYISAYKDAKVDLSNKHNEEFCKYSTLQYFEGYIYTEDEVKETLEQVSATLSIEE